MEHVRAVTVLESTSTPNNHKTTSSHTVLSNGKTYNLRDKNTINLNLNNVKDNNNNQTVSGQKVSSSTNSYDNVENKATDFLYEYFGLKFKSPIKWTNTIAIVIVHAIFLYAFLTYPLKSTILTTMWGKLFPPIYL